MVIGEGFLTVHASSPNIILCVVGQVGQFPTWTALTVVWIVFLHSKKHNIFICNTNSVTFFPSVLLVKSLHEVSGYIGGTVTLPSRANPSWTLSRIVWSIFMNTTWIATYRDGTTKVDRFYAYEGRLTLNSTSGKINKK